MTRRRVWIGVTVLLGVVAVFVAASPQSPPKAESLPALGVDDPMFPPAMEAHTASPIVGGNGVRLLFNGDEIFPAKLAAIRSARRSISYAAYFYADGPPARDVAHALADRCRAGVDARILLDGFGTMTMPREYTALLAEAGCRIETFRPIGRVPLGRHNYRNHRRILVVDGRVGLTGGSGVSEKWMGDGRTDGHWRDTDVLVEGPAVRWLQSAFAENWREATGELMGGDGDFVDAPRAGPHRAQVIRSAPATGDYAMYTMYLLAIASARRAIYITNPYFLPDDALQQALVTAARRGVRVVALTPGKIDHNVVRSASRRGFGPLFEAGVEIFEYQAALLHAKTMVIDGTWATVGSTNFDHRSFALSDELNVVLYDAAAIRSLVDAFEADLRHATRLTYEAWQNRGLRAKLVELFVIPIESQL